VANKIRKTKTGYAVEFYVGGNRIRKVLKHASRDEAKEYIENKIAEFKGRAYGGPDPDEPKDFNALADWYLAHPRISRKKISPDCEMKCKQCKPHSWKDCSYEAETRRVDVMREAFGTLELRALSLEDLEEFVHKRSRVDRKRDGNPLKPSSVNREITTLRGLFSLATKSGKIRANPAEGLSKLTGEEERDRVLSDEEWERYYPALPEWLKPVALCLNLTAMRLGEVINLTWDRVDRKNGFIRLRATDTKARKGRKVPIDPRLEEVLARIPRRIPREDTDPVFAMPASKRGIRQAGRQINRNSASEASRRALRTSRSMTTGIRA